MKSGFEIPVTRVEFEPGFRLDPKRTSVISVGSCFSEYMADLLTLGGMDCFQNPCGIVYNPVSIRDSIVRETPWTESDFFEFDGRFHCWSHHGKFSNPDRRTAAENAENVRLEFLEKLKKASLFLLTPATAVVFEHEGVVTANCHKVPGNRFVRRLLTLAECETALAAAADFIHRVNESCRIVFTVSPVRHHPGDLILNARSKALVLTAVHETVSARPYADYFPAYEIMTDELRDYRFYREDLLHPSETAARMITGTFAAAYFGEAGSELILEADRRKRSSVHRRKE